MKGELDIGESRELFKEVQAIERDMKQVKDILSEHDHRLEVLTKRLNGEWNKEDEMKYLKFAFQMNKMGKIPAIKEVRSLTGKGLKEAKDVVDGWEQ